MGYCMHQVYNEFFIAKNNKALALQAIKNLVGKETITDSFGQHFSWVTTEKFVNAIDLQSAMKAWQWEVYEDEDGNIEEIAFCGEKSGDDRILFNAIAMYVQKGSYIEMLGEDGFRWRWIFDGDTCKEKHAKVDWV